MALTRERQRIAGIPIGALLALTLLVFSAIVFLQWRWLGNSYAVSKQAADRKMREILEEVVNQYKIETADTTRKLLREMLNPAEGINWMIADGPQGASINYRYLERRYVGFPLPGNDTNRVKADPYGFLYQQLRTADFKKQETIYYMLVRTRTFTGHSREDSLDQRLYRWFTAPYKDAGLDHAATVVFLRQGMKFDGSVRYFADMELTADSIETKDALPAIPLEIIEDKSQFRTPQFSQKLTQLQRHIAYLNQETDTSYAVKPLVDELQTGMLFKIPFLRLSAKLPATYLLGKMGIGLAGSVLLTLFVALLLGGLLYLLVRQKRLSEIRNDFISNMSHEMKTPIATSLAAVQALQYTSTPRTEKEIFYIATAEAELRRLAQVAVKVLNSAVFESDQFILNPEEFELPDLLREVIAPWEIPGVKNAVISLEYQCRKTIVGDRLHLHQAIANLVENAVNYSPEPARVTIRCSEAADGITIRVSDEGSGIPAEYRAYVFDRFFRVPDLETGVRGYGLGLCHVKAIAAKHGGNVVLEHSGPDGSTFALFIPQ